MRRARLFSALSILTFFTIAALFLASPAAAQEDRQAKRYENVDWHQVVLVDFKHGKKTRAMEIVREYYDPATEKSGTQRPRAIEFQTGPWDMMLIWTMEDGPSEMTWETHPEGLKWMNAVAEIAGGEDKAQKILDEYNGLIVRTTSFVGLSGRHGMRIAGN